MVEILSAFLAPLSVVITLTILVLQYRLASYRWKLDLHDKRFPAYLAAMEYIRFVIQSGNMTDEEMRRFLKESRDKDLLFGDEIQKHIDQLWRKGETFMLLHKRLERETNDVERNRLIDETGKGFEWFEHQHDVTKQLFSKYLKIDKK